MLEFEKLEQNLDDEEDAVPEKVLSEIISK